MATFTVNSTADNTIVGDGLTTLREAIEAANTTSGVDSIVFDATVFAGAQTITLAPALGQLQISDSLSIFGTGQSNLTIDADGNSRVFQIDDIPASVTFDGLTITNGATTGAAVAAGTRAAGSQISRRALRHLRRAVCAAARRGSVRAHPALVFGVGC